MCIFSEICSALIYSYVVILGHWDLLTITEVSQSFLPVRFPAELMG